MPRHEILYKRYNSVFKMSIERLNFQKLSFFLTKFEPSSCINIRCGKCDILIVNKTKNLVDYKLIIILLLIIIKQYYVE